LERNIYNQENVSSIWGLFEQKYQKEMADKFKKLREAVKKMEEVANWKLDELCSRAESKLRDVLTMDPAIEAEYKTWEDKSFGLILKTEECSLEDKLKNLYDYNNTRLVNQGDAILDKLRKLEEDIPNRVEEIVKSITIDSND
jgi:hypothetical protein